MRVLLGNKFWYPKGGVETYLFELIEELSMRGFEVMRFGMKDARNTSSPYDRFFVDEVDYHAPHSWHGAIKTASRMLYSGQAVERLGALIDHRRPDFAHLHNIYHQLSPAILPLLTRRGIPVVMTLHDLKLICPNYKMRTNGEICERCKLGHYHHAVIHRCVRDSAAASALCALELFAHRWTGVYEKNVERFIVPSRFYLQKIAEGGIPKDKLVWIPSFTHIERYEPAYGGSDYFVYVGRLSEEKGLRTLLQAVRGIKGTLVIAGDGPLRNVLEQTVETDGLHNVRVVGPKWGHDLIDLIRGARFSVIPSEWYENCPRSCIESFACGTPVIGADIGGIPEMVEDGQTGLLFTPFSVADLRSKIEYLFARDDESIRMGRIARVKAERDYSAASHLDRLLSVYQSTTAGAACAVSA